MRVGVRTPHNEELEVHLHSSKVSLAGLKLAARHNGAHMSLNAMRLLDSDGRALPDEILPGSTDHEHHLHDDDHRGSDHHHGDDHTSKHHHSHSLSSLGIYGGSKLDIVQKPGETNIADLLYKQFFVQSAPAAGEVGVATTDLEIMVQFSFNAVGNALYLPSFKLQHDQYLVGQMQEELGVDEAAARGFKQWTEEVQPCKALLLELNLNALQPGATVLDEKSFDQVRFCYSQLNGEYMGVDVHSWQRYSSKPPVPVTIRVDMDQTIPEYMYVTPLEPLKHDTCYALLLQNGVHLCPKLSVSSYVNHFCHDFVSEDMLIPFRTKRAEDEGEVQIEEEQDEAKSD